MKGGKMQRYFVKDKDQDYLVLEDGDVHHIRNVMRNQIGDLIECVFQGDVYICQIEDLNQNYVKIVTHSKTGSKDNVQLTVAVGLVKEQKLDFILQKLTELGVSQIIPLKMERSIVKLGEDKTLKKVERWQKICKEAAEQSKRTNIPEVMEPMTLKQLCRLAFDARFVCSTKDAKKLNYHSLQQMEKCDTMIFVIGPEGGISPKEEEMLKAQGYQAVSFGKKIMRVETAAIYIASIINFVQEG